MTSIKFDMAKMSEKRISVFLILPVFIDSYNVIGYISYNGTRKEYSAFHETTNVKQLRKN